MFRHQGKTRTLKHNLKIASLLSFIAGIVNVAGFLSVQRLTTNVTGHFAFFIDEFFKLNPLHSVIYFLYIFFFLIGAFISGLITQSISRNGERYIYTAPASLECFILLVVGILGDRLAATKSDVVAFSLLFAMGLQNSIVTAISNATVRTTHLTGLFTDLGIELSQLLFYKAKEQRMKLVSSVKLRLTIIFFFFCGGVTGGFLYTYIKLQVLIFAGTLLIAGLIYDDIKFRIILLKRKYRNN
ncbi:MAG: DUF1275 domain-containing protein [Williamsia sp.]|nr:DUF1275 domain-containing protein [Williamsia sp.]